ncbi:MAG: DUF481 domain-containing protein [Acidobacteria bacterium]|nr:DUF481 domain-containing protein [Acidobacteriota bacterium]
MRLILWLILTASVMAQEAESKAWSNTTDLSWVETGGNSESSTIGFKNETKWSKGKHAFALNLAAVRAESGLTTVFAVGEANNPVFVENTETRLSDERYAMKAQYDYSFSAMTSWFSGIEWDRNEFAGIKNRTTLSSGIAHIWIKNDQMSYSNKVGLQYTDEEPVQVVEGIETEYAGLRANSAYMRKLGKNGTFKNDVDVVLNLNDTDDYRADVVFSYAVNINARLALKTSLQFLYDHQPAYKSVPLFDDDVQTGTVPFQLDDTDRVFTTSLVVTF